MKQLEARWRADGLAIGKRLSSRLGAEMMKQLLTA
jgi:hypothetical protein